MRDLERERTANADGAFELVLPAGPVLLDVSADRSLEHVQAFTLEPGRDRELIVALERAVVARGTIVDEESRPVADVQLHAESDSAPPTTLGEKSPEEVALLAELRHRTEG